MRLEAKYRLKLNAIGIPVAVLAADRLKGEIEKRRKSESIRLAVLSACRTRGSLEDPIPL